MGRQPPPPRTANPDFCTASTPDNSPARHPPATRRGRGLRPGPLRRTAAPVSSASMPTGSGAATFQHRQARCIGTEAQALRQPAPVPAARSIAAMVDPPSFRKTRRAAPRFPAAIPPSSESALASCCRSGGRTGSPPSRPPPRPLHLEALASHRAFDRPAGRLSRPRGQTVDRRGGGQKHPSRAYAPPPSPRGAPRATVSPEVPQTPGQRDDAPASPAPQSARDRRESGSRGSHCK